jgi:hypothetical protein
MPRGRKKKKQAKQTRQTSTLGKYKKDQVDNLVEGAYEYINWRKRQGSGSRKPGFRKIGQKHGVAKTTLADLVNSFKGNYKRILYLKNNMQFL